MATIADYIIVRDVPIKLSMGEEEEFFKEITLPKNTHRGSGESKPILAYVAEPINAENLNYEILVEDEENQNVTKIKSGSFNGSEIRGLWEAFQFHAESRKIKIWFKVKGGTGQVKFQDIVLWFQRDSQL